MHAPRWQNAGKRSKQLLGDIQNPRWLYIKGALLLGVGVIASSLLILDRPTLRTAAVLAIAIWGFCRAYYFAFYVVQHYVDPSYRFAGLFDFARYCWSGRRRSAGKGDFQIDPSTTKYDDNQ